jgi:hypothetical protein
MGDHAGGGFKYVVIAQFIAPENVVDTPASGATEGFSVMRDPLPSYGISTMETGNPRVDFSDDFLRHFNPEVGFQRQIWGER